MGFDVPLDAARVEAQAAHFRDVARRHDKPVGRPAAYDPALYRHQVPGGMISNLRSQMSTIGLGDRLPQVLDEIVTVRRELGYPIMVSPMSQFIGVQAIFNLLHGDRYAVVPTEIRNYALGWYGEIPAPIDADVFDRISDGAEPIEARPGSLMEPMIERFRRDHGPFACDEDLVLAMHYKGKLLGEWRRARGDAISYPTPTTPLATLLKELTERPAVSYVEVRKGATRLTYVT
jgi:pyruvate/oxaloacetate carboxyltransferase